MKPEQVVAKLLQSFPGERSQRLQQIADICRLLGIFSLTARLNNDGRITDVLDARDWLVQIADAAGDQVTADTPIVSRFDARFDTTCHRCGHVHAGPNGECEEQMGSVRCDCPAAVTA